MACNAEISTSTQRTISHRPISGSIPNPRPGRHGGEDPKQRSICAAIGRKEKEEGGKSKFGFGGLGCVRSSPVSVPEVIRTAASWEARKKKKAKKVLGAREGISADVCCGPGIGFAADGALVDCVDSRRPAGPRTSHRQRSAATRQYAFGDPDMSQIHGLRRRTPGGLPEILMLDTSPSLGRRLGSSDELGGWRLDVDRMSYEQELLALGDRIGYVGSGLREEEILKCIRKTKQESKDRGCSICQEGFEGEDEMGKLECNHSYHIYCIKQWLLQKNACPLCKASVPHS